MLVDAIGHCGKRAPVGRVVGICLTRCRRPCPRARVPCLFQCNNMVDVDIRWVAKPRTVVWRNPVAGNDVATDWVYLRAGDAVAFQYLIARIATVAVDVAPVFEE